MSKIIVDPNICNGQPIIEGRQITVAGVLQFLSAGDYIEDVLKTSPALTHEDVLECLAYSAALVRHPLVVQQIEERIVVVEPRPQNNRARVRHVQSAATIHRLLQGIHMYVDQHNKLPDRLEELDHVMGGRLPAVLHNPLRPEQQPAFIYIKPTMEAFRGEGKDQRPMIYENHSAWPGGIYIGFVDGHVDWIVDEHYALRLIENARNQ